MLTAYGGEELAVRAMKAGAMDYLPKGQLAADTLSHTVLNAIERFRMQQRIEQQQIRAAIASGATRPCWRPSRRWFGLPTPMAVWNMPIASGSSIPASTWKTRRMGWDRLLHPEDRERTRTAWNQATKSGSVFEIEHRLRQGH